MRAAIFRKEADYDAFERILRQQRVLTPLICPLVLFIFPGIFVILVGPAAIMMIRQLL